VVDAVLDACEPEAVPHHRLVADDDRLVEPGLEDLPPGPRAAGGWEPPARAAYRNLHGIRLPQWEKDR
jgi:hypothetical protein